MLKTTRKKPEWIQRYYNKNIFDFKEGFYEFGPHVHHLIVRDNSKKAHPMVTQVFFDEFSAEKMRWIGLYLLGKRTPLILEIGKWGENLNFLLWKKIENFPILDFARDFKLESIIDKQISQMDIYFHAHCFFSQVDPDFENFVYGQKYSNLIVGIYDPRGEFIRRERVISIPAYVKNEQKFH